MNDFEIRSYTKNDLALRYFPSATPHTAVNRLMSWICRCQHGCPCDAGVQENE